jgi:hypothetical protein
VQSRTATPLGTPTTEKTNPFAAAMGAVSAAVTSTTKGIVRPGMPGPLKSIVLDMQNKVHISFISTTRNMHACIAFACGGFL